MGFSIEGIRADEEMMGDRAHLHKRNVRAFRVAERAASAR
jgi:hypothetical protein